MVCDMVYIQSNIGVICFNTLFPPGGFCLCFWQKCGSALIGTAVAPFEGPVSLMGSQVQFLKLAMWWELGPGGHRALQTPLWNCVSSPAPAPGFLSLLLTGQVLVHFSSATFLLPFYFLSCRFKVSFLLSSKVQKCFENCTCCHRSQAWLSCNRTAH